MGFAAVTTAMAGAINYTYWTDNSTDWGSIPTSTYFYDKTDKLVHYKDSTGTIQEIFSGSGITVGTTPVTSGTNGRVFFQAGGVVQQDAEFLWDTTNKRMQLLGTGVIASPALNSVLEIKAKNGVSDIAFRVRNSTDSADIFSVRGNGDTLFDMSTSTTGKFRITTANAAGVGVPVVIGRSGVADSSALRITNFGITDNSIISNATLLLKSETAAVQIQGGSNLGSYYQSVDIFGTTNLAYRVDKDGRSIFTSSQSWYASGAGIQANDKVVIDGFNVLVKNSSTLPTTSQTDTFKLYSADITAGNAAPHFRTENGAIVKVYQETTAVVAAAFVANTSAIVDDTATFGGYTIGQVVAALKAQGLLA